MLLQHLPSQTTQLLVDLCCGTLSNKAVIQSSHVLPNGKATKSTAASSSQPSRPQSTDNASISSGRQQQPQTVTNTVVTTSEPASKLPSPKQFMAQFATQETEYIRFLREVLARRYNSAEDEDEESQAQARAMHNALLELYLSQAAANPSKAQELHSQALELLKSNLVDTNQAVLVCISAHFEPGIVLLYERLGKIEDLFRYRMRSSDHSTTIEMLWKFADRCPKLLAMALRWLTADASLLSQHTSDAERILQKIQEQNLMKPVEVVRLLSRHPHASVGLAKPYLKACFEMDAGEIKSNQGLVDSYKKEILEKKREFDNLVDTDKPQVFQVTRCSSCGGGLDNPSVQ